MSARWCTAGTLSEVPRPALQSPPQNHLRGTTRGIVPRPIAGVEDAIRPIDR